ncbi:zinc-ribbon domain-containing protein [Streptomyces sp. NRAIS4]
MTATAGGACRCGRSASCGCTGRPYACSLADAHPALIPTWRPERNGSLPPGRIASKSSFDAWWRCPAGYEWQEKVAQRSTMEERRRHRLPTLHRPPRHIPLSGLRVHREGHRRGCRAAPSEGPPALLHLPHQVVDRGPGQDQRPRCRRPPSSSIRSPCPPPSRRRWSPSGGSGQPRSSKVRSAPKPPGAGLFGLVGHRSPLAARTRANTSAAGVHCWPPIGATRESMASGLVRRVRRWR